MMFCLCMARINEAKDYGLKPLNHELLCQSNEKRNTRGLIVRKKKKKKIIRNFPEMNRDRRKLTLKGGV
jgi:hypothetical protein